MKKISRMKRWGCLVCALALAATVLGGCSGSKTGGSQSSGTDASGGDKIKVTVGIGNAFSPFCYLDENEKETGYDYEVMQSVAKELSGKYAFTFTPDAFANLIIGLDTKKYDMVVHHFGYTAERAQKYLYGKVADMYVGNFHIGFKSGRKDITDLKSMAGKTVVCSSGSMAETLILNWNKQNPDYQLKIQYSPDQDVWHTGIVNGLYDACVASQYDLDTLNKKYGKFLDYSSYNVTPTDYDCGTYFIYPKTGAQLQEDIDAALTKLKENGTLTKLSKKWLGGDYTKNPNTAASTASSGK